MISGSIKTICIEESAKTFLTKTQERIKLLGEVFTPTELVLEMLDKLPDDVWTDPTKTFLDPTCGNGQFLIAVLTVKKALGHNLEQALSTIYGADIMEDNVVECIERLYGPGDIQKTTIPTEFQTPGIIAMFTHNGKLVTNLVQADGLIYNYSFGQPMEFTEYTPELNNVFEWD